MDGPDALLRMAVDPDLREDDELSRQLVADVQDPRHGVLDAGNAIVEARGAERFSQLLSQARWQPEEPWTPLLRDLSRAVDDDPIERAGVRIKTIGPDRVDSWVAVHWSAFKGTAFTEQDRRDSRDWWLTVSNGPFYHRARVRSLAAFDEQDNAVAVTAVWSAGRGRPGLIEPMGVHRDHRGRGYGVAITVAAAADLRQMGSSSAIVCAESSNTAAVSTYLAAEFIEHPQGADLQRGA